MVLLNGVKYACERCIRGHRVSSCTHTDKPLTMIKPKGRPASQCLHCRELRKIKNTHSSCSCGKKGKSPGQHLASCLCHKNSHCTCASKDKKEPKPRVKGVTDGHDHEHFKSRDPPDYNTSTSSNAENNYFIEDVVVPFDTNHGLLDFLHSNTEDSESSISQVNAPHLISEESNPDEKLTSYGIGRLPNPPSDADLDVMENMFPLFPLVGTSSFDDSKSLPLLPLPFNNEQENLLRSNNSRPSQHGPVNSSGRERLRTDSRASMQSIVAPASNQFHPNNTFPGGLHQQNSATMIPMSNQSSNTQHPRPVKASVPTSGQHNSNRPRRPESVMSLASTSSNASRTNLVDMQPNQHFGLPKLSSSAAFPPFNFGDQNSTEDLYQSYLDNSTIFNNSIGFGGSSDVDEYNRSGTNRSINGTPQSSNPSRQHLQLRRKTSISRTQAHNQNQNLMKEHPLLPLKSASSAESSPSHSHTLCSPQSDKRIEFSNLQQSSNPVMDNNVSEWNLGNWPQASKNIENGFNLDDRKHSQLNISEDSIDAARFSDLRDYQDLSQIPMFLELVNPVKHES